MSIDCKKGLYLKIQKGQIPENSECQPDERLEHTGCATVVAYGPVAILADGRIRVTTGDAAVDILVDCGKNCKVQAAQDIILHPGEGRKVKVYGDLEVYGETTKKSKDDIPEKDDPLESET